MEVVATLLWNVHYLKEPAMNGAERRGYSLAYQ
jgi:hypothetical protein